MRVLVTGGSGFIGAHAISHLVAGGHEVHAISQARGRFPAGVEVHEADLLNESCQSILQQVRPSHLLHLAWRLPHNAYWTSTDNVRWLERSLQLLEAFAAAGGRRWVGAGTCAEYDWSQGGAFRESDPDRPLSLYGACKSALRITAERLGEQLGVEVAWGRIFLPYGPGDRPEKLVPSLIRSLLAGKPTPCTEGIHVRDFVYVDDVARAFVGLLDCQHRGAINIGSGVPVTVRHVVRRIGEIVGRPELLQFGAVPTRGSEPLQVTANIELLQSLGLGPRYPLDDGLRATIADLRSTSAVPNAPGRTAGAP